MDRWDEGHWLVVVAVAVEVVGWEERDQQVQAVVAVVGIAAVVAGFDLAVAAGAVVGIADVGIAAAAVAAAA